MYLQRSPQLIRARLPWVVGQAGLVVLAVFVYFRIRGLTESSVEVARTHAHHIIDIERFLGINVEAEVQYRVAPSESWRRSPTGSTSGDTGLSSSPR